MRPGRRASVLNMFRAIAHFGSKNVFTLTSEQAAAVGRWLLLGPAIIILASPSTLPRRLQMRLNGLERSLKLSDSDGADILTILFTSTLAERGALKELVKQSSSS